MGALGVLDPEAWRRELPPTANYLGVDLGDPRQLADLHAVAISYWAWRNGPVELWHRASRFTDTEMMRANAATTRAVRAHLPDEVVARLSTDSGGVLAGTRSMLTDPARCLPGGRTVLEVAAGAENFAIYAEQVNAFFDRYGKLVDRLGSREVVGALACYAAAACWKWWLAPGWPSIVNRFVDSLQKQLAKTRPSTLISPPEKLDLTRIRQLLMAGPDQLSWEVARCCRIAGLDARLPQDHGLSPRSRRLLPPAHQLIGRYLEFPVGRFRTILDELAGGAH
jgi:hypothetical protein